MPKNFKNMIALFSFAQYKHNEEISLKSVPDFQALLFKTSLDVLNQVMATLYSYRQIRPPNYIKIGWSISRIFGKNQNINISRTKTEFYIKFQ